MEVNEKSAAAKTTYQGREYFFCSPKCKDSFDKNPQHYAKTGQEQPQPHNVR
jgi:YHS domain-containing protein